MPPSRGRAECRHPPSPPLCRGQGRGSACRQLSIPGHGRQSSIAARTRSVILNADEAHQVRAIFDLYLGYSSMLAVVREIDRRGWRTKQWVTKRGRTQGGKPFTKGRLYRLLTNPIYTGHVHFKGQVYDGEQEAVIKAEIWESVQETLHRNGRSGRRRSS